MKKKVDLSAALRFADFINGWILKCHPSPCRSLASRGLPTELLSYRQKVKPPLFCRYHAIPALFFFFPPPGLYYGVDWDSVPGPTLLSFSFISGLLSPPSPLPNNLHPPSSHLDLAVRYHGHPHPHPHPSPLASCWGGQLLALAPPLSPSEPLHHQGWLTRTSVYGTQATVRSDLHSRACWWARCWRTNELKQRIKVGHRVE